MLAAMERWAADDLRSVNAQIEYVLRQALVSHGRVKLVEKVVVEVEDVDTSIHSDDSTQNLLQYLNLLHAPILLVHRSVCGALLSIE